MEILYKNGGIYLDIKYKPLNNFKFIIMTEKEHFVLDIDNIGIYNALMVCLPGNKILFNAIEDIVNNVKNNFYGNSSLEPTGPLLLAKYFQYEEKKNFDMCHKTFLNNENRFIYYKNYIAFKSYNGYIKEHNQNKKVEHYSILWDKRNIYNN